MGFKGSWADSSIFINKRGVIIALYVDDILVLSKSQRDIQEVKEKLQSFHPMKDARSVDKILGIRVTRDEDPIMSDQEAYIMHILEEFGMEDSKTVLTAVTPHVN